MVRMVHHVFAEIALAAVGARVGVAALNVAILRQTIYSDEPGAKFLTRQNASSRNVDPD
jgi:hypothetical protein